MPDRLPDPALNAAQAEGVQPDPALKPGRIHPIWLWAVGIVAALVLWVVFYGLNEPPRTEQAGTPPAATSAQDPQAPGPTAPTAPNKG